MEPVFCIKWPARWYPRDYRDSMLYSTVKMRDERDPIRITISTFTGKEYKIRMSPSDTIMDIKLILADISGLGPLDIDIIFRGFILLNRYTIEEYEMEWGDRIIWGPVLRGGPRTTCYVSPDPKLPNFILYPSRYLPDTASSTSVATHDDSNGSPASVVENYNQPSPPGDVPMEASRAPPLPPGDVYDGSDQDTVPPIPPTIFQPQQNEALGMILYPRVKSLQINLPHQIIYI